MATENIAVDAQRAQIGNDYDLWIGGGGESVLTITLNKQCRAFPPTADKCGYLNQMIQGLARAAKAVTYHAENDPSADTAFAIQPVDDIVDAIIMLSQLSEAIRAEASS